jgi:hypothetical protein
MDKANQTLELNDGRIPGYAEYGGPDGKPVFQKNVIIELVKPTAIFR